jgi:Raf kinase inhibitor-like YbhB/YbcL family protein
MRWPTLAFAIILAGASPAVAMRLTSQDIMPEGVIPPAHIYVRCGGGNLSPELTWSRPPAAAKSLVLTMIDMDVKPALWSHWIVVGLPPVAAKLPRGGLETLPTGAHAVASNFGEAAYDGPCPPPGSGVHRYQFTVWAMPTPDFAVAPDENAVALIARLQAAAIDHASLIGTVASKP